MSDDWPRFDDFRPGKTDLLDVLGLDPAQVVPDSFEVAIADDGRAVVQWEEFDEDDRPRSRRSTVLTGAEAARFLAEEPPTRL